MDEYGNIRIYDSDTNTFGSYNADATTRTFMKPTREDYFNDQPGFAPDEPIVFDDIVIDPFIDPIILP